METECGSEFAPAARDHVVPANHNEGVRSQCFNRSKQGWIREGVLKAQDRDVVQSGEGLEVRMQNIRDPGGGI
jgi:hypothetical protein